MEPDRLGLSYFGAEGMFSWGEIEDSGGCWLPASVQVQGEGRYGAGRSMFMPWATLAWAHTCKHTHINLHTLTHIHMGEGRNMQNYGFATFY